MGLLFDEEENESSPVDLFFGGDVEQEPPNRLQRGIYNVTSGAEFLARHSAGDQEGAAQVLAERRAAQDLIQKHKTIGELEIGAAWDREEGFFDSIANVIGEVGDSYSQDGFGAAVDDVSYILGGLVEQMPNMVPAMGGMAVGAGAGALTPIPGGTAIGALSGATAGNAVVETAGMAEAKAMEKGIDLTDPFQTAEFLRDNKWQILKESGIKSGTIGLVDLLTLKGGRLIMKGPSEKVANKILNKMGVDVSDSKAFEAAIKSPEFRKAFDADPLIKAATTKTKEFMKTSATELLEVAGEFTGEFVGTGLAVDEWNPKEAGLEAISSLGQSTITTAGQFAYQKGAKPIALTAAQKIRRAEQRAEAEVVPTGDVTVDQTNIYNRTADILEEEQAKEEVVGVERENSKIRKETRAATLVNKREDLIAKEQALDENIRRTIALAAENGVEANVSGKEEMLNGIRERIAAIGAELEGEGVEQPKQKQPAEKEKETPAEEPKVKLGNEAASLFSSEPVEEQASPEPQEAPTAPVTDKVVPEEQEAAPATEGAVTAPTEDTTTPPLEKATSPTKEEELRSLVSNYDDYYWMSDGINVNKAGRKVDDQIRALQREVEGADQIIAEARGEKGSKGFGIKYTAQQPAEAVQLDEVAKEVVAPAKEEVVAGTAPTEAPAELVARRKELEAEKMELGEKPDDTAGALEWTRAQKRLNRQIANVEKQIAEAPAPAGEPLITKDVAPGNYTLDRNGTGPLQEVELFNGATVKGRKVDIAGLNRETYVVKQGKEWRVVDKKTGANLSPAGKTQKEAVDAAINKIVEAGPENFQAAVERAEADVKSKRGKLFARAKTDATVEEMIPENLTVKVKAVVGDGETTKVTMNAKKAFRRLQSHRQMLKDILDCVKS